MPKHKIETRYIRAEIKHPRRWLKRNCRRIDLLCKKHDGVITEEEAVELDELTVELTMMQCILLLPTKEHNLREHSTIEAMRDEMEKRVAWYRGDGIPVI